VYTPGAEFLYNRYLYALLEYVTPRCVLIAQYCVALATRAPRLTQSSRGDVTGVFQIRVDHCFVLMLRRDNSVASPVQFHGGEAKLTARVVTVVVFITKRYEFGTDRAVNKSQS
jgi:hypothetical protein